ncbi:MAG: hypothetical protein KC646_08065 [Candidatus Cloacimonetes bacterium]|nr:hypothetical protein [Candidatus Cloacimonadota bacterium]
MSLIDSGPSFYRLDNLPHQNLETLLNKVKSNKQKTYKEFSLEAKFPLIMEGLSPFVTLTDTNQNTLQKLLKKDNPSLNEFAQLLAIDYTHFLKQSGELNDNYISFNIPKDKPVVRLYLTKKYYLPNSTMKQNYATSELFREYQKYKRLNQL